MMIKNGLAEVGSVTAAVTHVDAGSPWSGVGDAQTLLDLFVPALQRGDAPAMIFEDGLGALAAELLEPHRALRRLPARARRRRAKSSRSWSPTAPST